MLRALGRPTAARAALEEALQTFDGLPRGQQNPKARERVQKELEAL
jgi:hypothetical protein